LSSSAARLQKRKAKIDTTAERIATMTVTVRPARENHQPLTALWSFEQGQAEIDSIDALKLLIERASTR
jgi:hypothetical protein